MCYVRDWYELTLAPDFFDESLIIEEDFNYVGEAMYHEHRTISQDESTSAYEDILIDSYVSCRRKQARSDAPVQHGNYTCHTCKHCKSTDVV